MRQKKPSFSLTNTARNRIPPLPFKKYKEKILGKRFTVSLVFADSKTSKKLNRIYRSKNKPANVLTFPLSKTSGEIFIDLAEVRKSAPIFSLPLKKMLALVFIHACLHLKGVAHGSTMEKEERRSLAKLYR